MIVSSVASFVVISQGQDRFKKTELRSGELVRLVERTVSRRGTYEQVLVLTAKKAFSKEGEIRHSALLTSSQQSQLKTILAMDPAGLRSKKRSNPMWPSAYDGSDMWMCYRVGSSVMQWGNNEFEYPGENCSLTKWLDAIRNQLNSK
jgi:hypothetical protein